MKVHKKIIGFLTLIISFIFLLGNVSATENKEELIKKIAPDGKNAVFKMKRPSSIIEGDFNVNGYVNNLFNVDGYYIQAACLSEPYEDCIVEIYTKDYSETYDPELRKSVPVSGWKGVYNINVTYDEPKENATINNYINKLNKFDSMDPKTYYVVEDLSLINYYLTSNNSELWNHGASGRALRYSNINDVTKGSNMTYFLDIRAGNQDETLMYESAFGPMSVFYNGYSYGAREEGIYLKRVIYIPKDTNNNPKDYALAAQKRISEYLEDSSLVKVTYGGTLSSLGEYSEDVDYPVQSDDGNYYNVTVGKRTYKFYVIKADSSLLVNPTYISTDINSNIEVTSDNSSIPLDTALTVNELSDSTISEKIGTQNYKLYDINLYSSAKNSKIEKLDNGKFLVKIPIPSDLNEKNLVVYYIPSSGEKEAHEVTVKDGYASFETDHFSTYVLAEKVSTGTENNTIKNPNTFDNIALYVSSMILSFTGLTCAVLYLRRKKKTN